MADELARRLRPLANPATRAGARCRRRRSTGSGGATRRSPSPRRRSSSRAAWGAPGASGARCACSARSSGDDGLDDLGRRSRCSTARPRGSSSRRRSRRSARRCGGAGAAGRARAAAPGARARERVRRRRAWPSTCARALRDRRAAAARRRQRPGPLTASERRVADLAAGGETNRDIAQALFVTPKTVEVHLSNAYRKLGIRSRRELAGALEVSRPFAASRGRPPKTLGVRLGGRLDGGAPAAPHAGSAWKTGLTLTSSSTSPATPSPAAPHGDGGVGSSTAGSAFAAIDASLLANSEADPRRTMTIIERPYAASTSPAAPPTPSRPPRRRGRAPRASPAGTPPARPTTSSSTSAPR